jgi:hypothetical protein
MTPERWQQITGMFHAALLRDSGHRQTFLQDACGADEALRAEVEAMLTAHDNAGDPGSIRRSRVGTDAASPIGYRGRSLQDRTR